jgi:predicted glycoside hydrolase/deacetylase ChbG (UPF0249 family)
MFQSVPAEPRIRISSLVVTADDLGHGSAQTRAIVECLRRDYVTHASLLVNLDGFDEACELVRAERLEHRIGLHLNFTDGVPLTDPMKRSARFCIEGRFRFPMLGRGLLALPSAEKQIVHDEAAAQFARARSAGFPITHFDSHHHVHTVPNLASILLPLAAALGVRRVRRFSNCKPPRGWFRRVKDAVYGWQLDRMSFETTRRFGDLDDLEWIVRHRKPIDGSVELMTHPTLSVDGAIVDGIDRKHLSDRLLQLRPYVPALIHETGRIRVSAAPSAGS